MSIFQVILTPLLRILTLFQEFRTGTFRNKETKKNLLKQLILRGFPLNNGGE